MPRLVSVLLLLPLLFAGCARKNRQTRPARIGSTETGIASWYGEPHHGRRAANGEIFDMYQLTAAHKTLPFGTWVRVLNLENGKTVDVRITDRGPFIKGRIIDLSRAAAVEAGIFVPGIARVRLQIIQPPHDERKAWYGVQVGAFRERQNAERLRVRMEQYGPAVLVQRGDATWRVLVGRCSTRQEAEELAAQLPADAGSGFPVRLD